MPVEGKKVLVLGLARSGMAAIELLRRHGARVTAADSKPLAEIADAAPRLRAMGVDFLPQTEAPFHQQDLVVISPGVPADLPELEEARRRGVAVVGEMEVASWYLRGRIIAITGSNGKTTTTALTGHILTQAGIPCQVGGNIGRPAASMVETSTPDCWNVLEASSFQLETIQRFRAHAGVALNLTPDHLDRHKTLEAYAAAKGRLFETQSGEDFAILNADDPFCVACAARSKARPLWFSQARPVTPGLYLEGGAILFDGRELMTCGGIPLRGGHNVDNVMAAAAAARLAGAKMEQIAEAVRCFPGVEHRLEYARTVRGVDYFNDSKATNVDATLKAIGAFAGRLWIILGGKDKDSDYAPLREPLRRKAVAALLIGAAAAKIARQISGAVPVIECGGMRSAVEEAFRQAAPGDTVLLAPACASFDQFDNFEHRGRVFKQLVSELEERS